LFGVKTVIFQILKTVQGQEEDQDKDRFDQNQDLKKMVLRPAVRQRPVLRTTSLLKTFLIGVSLHRTPASGQFL